MSKSKLSVIMPFVNEYPQNYFTLQNVFLELHSSDIEWEIITIDNFCPEILTQLAGEATCPTCKKSFRLKRIEDVGGKKIAGVSTRLPNCKHVKYNTKLGHWGAKNAGMEVAEGDIFFFMDAHCILTPGMLPKMFKFYIEHREELNGSLHMPISYMLERPGKELTYKLVVDRSRGIVHYSFTRCGHERIYKAPCMSTCGMMISRDILIDKMGGWPDRLGIYGGGENFTNFVLAILGYDTNIFNYGSIWHFAEKRGYNWNYTNYHTNRAIATYMFGGHKWLKTYLDNLKGNPSVWAKVYYDTLESCAQQKALIDDHKKISIEDWLTKWGK